MPSVGKKKAKKRKKQNAETSAPKIPEPTIWTECLDKFMNPQKIMVTGLMNAGKTKLLERLQLGPIEQSQFRKKIDLETLQYKDISICAWDTHGEKIRPCDKTASALIFMIDGTNEKRFNGASHSVRTELLRFLLDDDLNGIPVLIFINKIDKRDCLTESQAFHTFGLAYATGRQWDIRVCSVLTGEGVLEGLQWLVETINLGEQIQEIKYNKQNLKQDAQEIIEEEKLGI